MNLDKITTTASEEIILYSLEEVKANLKSYEDLSRRGNVFASIVQKITELGVVSYGSL